MEETNNWNRADSGDLTRWLGASPPLARLPFYGLVLAVIIGLHQHQESRAPERTDGLTAVTNGRVLRISDWPYAQPPAAGAYDPEQALGWLHGNARIL